VQWRPTLYRGGIAWIDVSAGGFVHRLIGNDHYWRAGDRFGVVNDSGTAYSWRVDGRGRGFVTDNRLPPDDACWYDGILVPDDVWAEMTDDRHAPLLP
jgi:hypothetical protein